MELCFRRTRTKVGTIKPAYIVPNWCTDDRERFFLIELREEAEFDLVSDDKAVRVLRAKGHLPRRAMNVLRNHVVWLGKYQPETITWSMLRVQVRTGCWRMMGHDKAGRPIIWIRTCFWNPEEFTIDQFVMMITWFILQASGMRRNGAETVIGFMDSAGWKASHVLYHKHSQALVDTAQKQFPELVGSIWLANANWLFHQAWKVIKGWCDEDFQRKIRFFSNETLTQEFLEFVDADELPKMYGGNKETPGVPNVPGIENIVVEPVGPYNPGVEQSRTENYLLV
eukprot:c10131_g1_i1.p1 GENE.c10131_g1_i1~~c10131_g1_i1.p1  ORF type:complete len:283 (+),score=57.73 c10131_g1_i1:25-873(+)